jgi:dextranase
MNIPETNFINITNNYFMTRIYTYLINRCFNHKNHLFNFTISFLSFVLLLCFQQNVYSQKLILERLTTDKAAYKPGQTVHLSSDIENHSSGLQLEAKYYYLGQPVGTPALIPASGSTVTWDWLPPGDDFKGYTIVVKLKRGESVLSTVSTAVDVSSDWTKFPRYGFLTNYNGVSDNDQNNVVNNLKRHHINGIQFYDWMEKHHKPYPGKNDWYDLLNRHIVKSTVQNYISKLHDANMKAMAYDLIYGILGNYANEGVSKEWLLYKKADSQYIDYYDTGCCGNIYFANPGNKNWQNYLMDQLKYMYDNLAFDGWHIDQLGNPWEDPGNGVGRARYDYSKNQVSLPDGYQDFINTYRKDPRFAGKLAVMNAVGGYGQEKIMKSDVAFGYLEPWPWDPMCATYDDLHQQLAVGREWSNGKSTVFAAYINYELSKQKPGSYFNENSVLRADAVIFASGGSHLQLGEHMLGNEYFPNSSTKMPDGLKPKLIRYYDFSVAYQNLLRDGGTYRNSTLQNGEISAWPGQAGKIACMSKLVGDQEVFHLINFTNSGSMKWRDDLGTEQGTPTVKTNLQVSFTAAPGIGGVWYASPDDESIEPKFIDFKQDANNVVTCTVPQVNFWTMLVAEKSSKPAVAKPSLSPAPGSFTSEQTVNITAPVQGAIYRYTLDGSIPTASSPQFPEGGLRISTTKLLKVYAAKPDMRDSEIFSGSYVIGTAGNCQGTGAISMEKWNNITGQSVDKIPVNTTPGEKANLTDLFEITSNTGDNYGVRLSGVLCAPETGGYTFYIAGDDYVQLNLSTDESVTNKKQIAYHNSWTNPRQWDKLPSQKSALIQLTAGKKYYIEALMKENDGGDNLAVRWVSPSGMDEVVPATYIIPMKVTGLFGGKETHRSINLYPNPASTSFTIDLSAFENETMELAIFNELGTIVATHTLSNEDNHVVNTSALAKGVYMVQLKGQKSIAVEKLIIHP